MTPPDQAAGARRRILVVEDEYLVADYTSMMLVDLGYEVVALAATVPEAITVIGKEQIDAVLLDANLNGTSSAPIADELIARHLPFIVVTGYGNLELASATLQQAPRVHKPLAPEDLLAVLAKTLAP